MPDKKVKAAFMNWYKNKAIKLVLDLGVAYGKTPNCYSPNTLGETCGHYSS